MADSITFDQEKHIVIGGKIYEKEALSDEMRAVISHINAADQEIYTMEHNQRVYKLGRDGMVRQLIEKIDAADGLTPVGVVPDQGPGGGEVK
ncbi:MAG: DUF6447 family protein [Synechococcus sp.]